MCTGLGSITSKVSLYSDLCLYGDARKPKSYTIFTDVH